ncbi:MAG: aldehyde dehydrogenase family protein [Actinomycetota bacterium]
MAAASKSGRKAVPETLKSIDPRTGEVMREIPATPIEEVPLVVERARKMAPEWAGIGVEGRARMLNEVRHRIYDRIDDIVRIVGAESGKSAQEVLTLEVFPTLILLSSMGNVATRALKPEKAGRLMGSIIFGTRSRVEWRPYGVVGAITPWNYPVTNCFLGFLSALYAGNTVVCKPSEVTPASGELIGELLDVLPPNVFTIIQGGGDVGAALVDAPCDKISFIGSPPTGRKILEAAAKHLTPTVMELGGKDASIVCEDADIEVASSGVAWGSFYNAGQTCCSMERVFVHEAVADRFEERLLEKVSRIKRGQGGSPMGPLTFKPQLEKVERQVQDAIDKGARVLSGGPEAWSEKQGFWYAPTVLADVNDEMEVFREESFGPVVTITRVQDDDEAIRRANEDGVNLTASVWSTDRRRISRISSRLKAGVLSSNEHGALPAMGWAPWGGVGESGFGRLNGVYGVREFAIPTHHADSLSPRMKKPYWYPYNEVQEKVVRGMAGVLGARTIGGKLGAVKDVAAGYVQTLRSRL